MKRLFTKILVALLAVAPAFANSVPLWYKAINGTECKVVKSEGAEYAGDIEIPETATLNGVTYTVVEIDEYAFYSCKQLTSVSLPKTLRVIGKCAFESCDNLAVISLGTGVKTISDYAFNSVKATKSLVIPENVDSIGYNAFANMTALENLRFDDGATAIRFNDWQRYNFYTDSLRTLYCGRPLPNKRFRPEYARKLHTITFGPAVTSIPESFADNDTCLTTINFSENVVEIGDYAFQTCKHLPKVAIPEATTLIGKSAFEYCDDLAVISLGTGVKTISDYAFNSVKATKSLVIPENVDSIGYQAFANMTALENLRFDDGATAIRFNDWQRYNFYTDSLRTLYCGRPLPNKRFRPEYARKLHTITFGPAVTSIPESFADNDTCLTTINFSENVVEIGDYAFQTCKHLPKVAFPEATTLIGKSAFEYCDDLAVISLGTGVKTISDYAFNSVKATKSLVIPENVDSIGYNAFANMTGLENLRFDDGATAIRFNDWQRYNFYTDSLRTLYCGRPLPNKRFRPEYARKLHTITFGPAVTSIPESFADNDTCLTTINFSENVVEIGDYAFQTCKHLPKVAFPEATTLIGKSAFEYCDDLAVISLGTGVKTISDYAFNSVKATKSLVIPENVDSIGYNAFANMTSLENLRFDDGATAIRFNDWQRYNFYTDSLRTLYCGRPLPNKRFRPTYATKLWKVGFGANVTEIPEDFAYGVKTITHLECFSTVPPTWGKDAFQVESGDNGYKIWNHATLYVQEEAIPLYKSTDPWSNFFNVQVADGIDVAETETPALDGPIYNLQGVRVGADYKGIVIKNGKKFLQK